MIFNVIFIAYYLKFVFKSRLPCIHEFTKADGTQVKQNVSATFNLAFVVGLLLHLVNFTVCTFLEPATRMLQFLHPPQEGGSKHSKMFVVGYLIDLVFRVSFILFSAM